MKQRIALVAALALATVASAAGYYLPGTYPQEFFIGQQLQGKQTHKAVKCSLLTVMACSGAAQAVAEACLAGFAHLTAGCCILVLMYATIVYDLSDFATLFRS